MFNFGAFALVLVGFPLALCIGCLVVELIQRAQRWYWRQDDAVQLLVRYGVLLVVLATLAGIIVPK